ncbi:MAG: hypothetical protein C0605_03675 [Hyphomicrobiales bacterium]|nr:MAG: hypothetical protein C0605_03675 [Hyphomicrobiales bacterium]
MTSVEFLLLVRGPLFAIATLVMIFGLTLRLFEIFMLGRKANLAATRAGGTGPGFRTMFRRFAPVDKATFSQSVLLTIAGYIFHIGLFITVFLYAAHVEIIGSVLGFRWPALPSPLVDFAAVLTMAALLALLWRRLTHPVVKYLTKADDLLVWALTFAPVLTGYLTYHHLVFSYSWLLAVHILSVELLMVAFPFTKLTHAITLFFSRWYTGAIAGEKGVQL